MNSELELIVKYFADLKYSKISGSPKCVLVHNLGTVHIVEFENTTTSGQNYGRSNTTSPCYAIVKDGVVTGYNTDFWTDANQHRLVLKQHLGMLEMEKSESVAPQTKKPENASDRASISPEVLSSIVKTYEEKIVALSKKLSDEQVRFRAEHCSAIIRGDLALRKLDLIKDVLAGKAVKSTVSDEKTSPEEDAVGAVFDDPEHDATEIAEQGMRRQKPIDARDMRTIAPIWETDPTDAAGVISFSQNASGGLDVNGH